MRFKMVPFALLPLLAAGCGRGVGPGTEIEGEISRSSDTLGDRLEDAEDLLFAEGRPVEDGFPCAEFNLSSGNTLAIVVSSDDFDPVAVAVDREGAVIALCDDWEDETEARLVLSDVPRGSKLFVFALDGSSGEFALNAEEADSADVQEFTAMTDLSSGMIKGELIEDKDDDLLSDALEDELDSFLYTSGYGIARIHVFTLAEEQLISLALSSDDFDPLLALVSVDDHGYDYIASNDDFSGGLQSRIDQVLEPGLYAAVVLPYAQDAEGSYNLSFTAYGVESLQAEIVQAETPGETCTGSISAGTSFAISIWPEITAEKPYDLMLSAATPCAFFEFDIPRGEAGLYDIEAASEALDTYLVLLRIEDGVFTVIGFNDDSYGSDSRLTKVLAPGAYTAIVTSYSGEETGEVQFDYKPAAMEPSAIIVDRPVDALVSWDATELYYTLDVMAGSIYTVSVSSADLDPYVEAVFTDGTTLSDDDSGGYPNASLRIDPSPGQSGPVILVVKDYAGGSTGSVRIEVTQERRSEGEAFALYD